MSRCFSCLLLLLSALCSSGLYAEGLYIASWNVENLFDLEDDPEVELDEEFTPDGEKSWTADRLARKLANLAGVIRKMNGGRGPDVLGLCEVENRQVVEMLVDELSSLGRNYEIVHQDSTSDRGIDCALLYDAAVFGLADAKFHFVDAERTRDILEARLRRDEEELFVFVNHWPSRRNEESQRITAAAVLRKRIDEILAADPKADILMMGDFNDEPENVALIDHLRAAARLESDDATGLYNTTAPIHAAAKGSIVWDNKWQLFDQIIVSPGLRDDDGFRWKRSSSRAIEFPELFFQPSFPGAIARPSRSYSDNRFHKTGYSDHLPVACLLIQ